VEPKKWASLKRENFAVFNARTMCETLDRLENEEKIIGHCDLIVQVKSSPVLKSCSRLDKCIAALTARVS